MMLSLDRIAKRYGVRPSELVGVTDPVLAFCIDMHAHNWGVQQDVVDRRRAEAEIGRR